MVKVVTERIEKPEEDSSQEETKSKSNKPRADKLPPVEILFAHLDRVDTMKTRVEPMVSEMSSRTPAKRGSTVSHTSGFFNASAVGSFRTDAASVKKL